MFIPCICSSTVYSPITLYQHTLSDKSFVFTFQSDSSLLLPTFSPYDVLFTSCSLSHYKDKILEQLATDPSVGQSYSTLSSVTLINTKPLLSSIYSPTIARTYETVSFLVAIVSCRSI